MSTQKKKIVFPVYGRALPFFKVGADISRNNLAYLLAEKNYHVSCIASYGGSKTTYLKAMAFCIAYLNKWGVSWEIKEQVDLHYSFKGVNCVMTCLDRFYDLLEKNIQKDDVVFVVNKKSVEILKIAKIKQAVVVAYITDAIKERRSLYAAKPDFIFYDSEVLASFGKQFHQQEYHILPAPFMPTEKILFPIAQKKCVTLINPIPMKGLHTFLALSKRFPNYIFQAVEGWEAVVLEEEYLQANVRYFGRQYDMAPIYRATGILLCPSHYSEGFGRTVIEAALYGVPSIVSTNGALPVVLGDGGLALDSFDIEKWTDALLEIEKKYDEYSAKAYQNAQHHLIDFEAKLREIGVL